MNPFFLAFAVAALPVAAKPADMPKPAPKPASVKVFADWAVACDNGRRCEAVSLIPEDAESAIGLWLRREAGPAGELTVHLRWPGGASGAAALLIDGTRFALTGTGDDSQAGGGDALAIARALAKAGKASAVAGKAEQPVFTRGSAAALRYIDAAQGRAGTVTALVALGRAAARAVPAPPPLPVIAAPPIATMPPAAPGPATIAAMRKQARCAVEDDANPSADAYALDDRTTLVLLSCGSGAYNVSFVPYVLTASGFRPATADAPTNDNPDADPAAVMLTNADVEEGIVTSVDKGRGVGDCGVAQRFAWDGTRLRLIGQSELGECRGGVIWPTTWRARVARR